MALEKMVYACEAHQVKACGSFRKIKRAGNDELEDFELHRAICKGYPEGVELDYRDYQDDYHYQNYVFDLQMIKENKIVFPHYRRYQDPPFFLKAMLAAKKMWVLPVELYCYRLGHQDFRNSEKQMIFNMLRGICDNMEIACKYSLEKLQERLLYRINYDYYLPIVKHFDKEICMLLCEIQRNLLDQNIFLRPLEEMGRYYELSASHFIMRMLVEARHKSIGIEEYLSGISVKKIALYGLGTFGTALYNELKSSEICIICGIDKKKKRLDDELPVVSDISEAYGYDAVIVTPLKEGESIAESLKKIVTVPVYTLTEILCQIEKIWETRL